MNVTLRVLTPNDIPTIAALIAASVEVLQRDDYTAAQREAALRTVFTVDTRLVADGGYLGAFADSRLVACGGWSARKTLYGGDHQIEAHEPAWLDPATDAAKIRAIFVHPSCARQGLGRLLLHAAEAGARAAGFHRFEMGSTLTGLALYRQEGYRETHRVQVPVAPGEYIEVIHMTKDPKQLYPPARV